MASESQDVVMMDVDEVRPPPAPPKMQLFATITPKWVAAPSTPEELMSIWTAENANQHSIIKFLKRWPPSRTPSTYGPWIHGVRTGERQSMPTPNIEGLTADFKALVAANNVSIVSMDQIAKANNVLAGKWMVFEESKKIDVLWGKILFHVCVERKKGGQVKVSTWKEGEKHVICAYVEDYTNSEEVSALRQALRSVGVKWKIGFKTDAYTYLNIYKENPWKLRPSRFHE